MIYLCYNGETNFNLHKGVLILFKIIVSIQLEFYDSKLSDLFAAEELAKTKNKKDYVFNQPENKHYLNYFLQEVL